MYRGVMYRGVMYRGVMYRGVMYRGTEQNGTRMAMFAQDLGRKAGNKSVPYFGVLVAT